MKKLRLREAEKLSKWMREFDSPVSDLLALFAASQILQGPPDGASCKKSSHLRKSGHWRCLISRQPHVSDEVPEAQLFPRGLKENLKVLISVNYFLSLLKEKKPIVSYNKSNSITLIIVITTHAALIGFSRRFH